jgi:hypothetical protein
VPGVAPAAAPGAAQAAGDSRPVTRGTHHRATPVCSRQAPAIAPVACSRRMPLSHHGHRGRATASPALYHAQPPNPTFLPHHPVPFTPNEPRPPGIPARPESPPARNPRPPGIPARPRIRPAPRSPRRPCFGPPLPVRPRSRRRTLWNAMKPGIQCVLTPWIRGFTTSGALRPTSGAQRPAPCVRQQAAPAPLRAIHPREPECQPNERRTRTQTERNPLIRGKPFLTASNTLADYAELPTARPGPERIEGVSRSLPFSDLLALTSSHMFFSVMN